MSAFSSALYIGQVGHTRHKPKRHSLRYGVFMLWLDLDEIEAVAQRLKWFSLGRFNLTSFHPEDFGDRSGRALRTQVEGHLAEAGLDVQGGPIRLLCLPRVLGYVFNPISVYFCYRRDGALYAILYEVSSTFGERHSYLMPVEPDDKGLVHQIVGKRLHVSPFMGMDLTYRFQVTPPEAQLRISIEASDSEGLMLSASFTARRQPLTDRDLIKAWLTHPLLTLKVILAIHWEAVKIALKGIGLKSGPKAPVEPVSLGLSERPVPDR